ncbi:MAG: hypothetical protein JWQ76_4343 [Ramlibacter sp.]|nr:hypothetical protein [Ramlibacter sp.]
MRRSLLPPCLLGLMLVSSAPAWPQAPAVQGVLPATLPLRREPASTVGAPSWLAATGALALLALGGTVMVGRRRQWTWLQAGRARIAPGHELVRISSQALTAQASLHAVRWNGEELLLACTPQQVTLLARHPVLPLQGDVA